MTRDKYWRPPTEVPPEVLEERNRKRRFRDQLDLITEYLDEDSFVEAVKKFNPTPDELKEWVRLFREIVREKRRL
jgi:hypothetical protein